jgi:hypothetical protein
MTDIANRDEKLPLEGVPPVLVISRRKRPRASWLMAPLSYCGRLVVIPNTAEVARRPLTRGSAPRIIRPSAWRTNGGSPCVCPRCLTSS